MGALTYDNRTFTTAANAANSAAVEVESGRAQGLLIPSGLTSTTIQIQVSQDNSTWYIVKDSTGTQALNFAASTGGFAIAANDMDAIRGYRYFRVVFGTTQGTVTTMTYCWNKYTDL